MADLTENEASQAAKSPLDVTWDFKPVLVRQETNLTWLFLRKQELSQVCDLKLETKETSFKSQV